MSKKNEISTVVSEEAIALLRESYPVEQSFNRILLPRIGMTSQDVTEGKGKSMKVVMEAGTFFTDRQSDEEVEGKKLWKKDEIGISIEGIILFQRKQLRHYDSGSETYTSSPIYDNDEQIIPLFRDKQEVDRGTPKDLKSRKEYQGVSAKGKPISKLEENRILYVMYKDEVYQLNLRGTSMYAFLTYARKTLPPSVLTKFSSEAKENGSITWNQMSFEVVRALDNDEVKNVIDKVKEIKEMVELEKSFYASKNDETDIINKDF